MAQDLQGLLKGSLNQDTASACSEQLRNILSNPNKNIATALAELIISADTEEERQLAAILFRRKCHKIFEHLSKEEQFSFADSLILRFNIEPGASSRRANAHLLACMLNSEAFYGDKTKQVLQTLSEPLLQGNPEAQWQQLACVEVCASYIEVARCEGEVPFFYEILTIFSKAFELSGVNPLLANASLRGLKAMAEADCDQNEQLELYKALPGVMPVIEATLCASPDIAKIGLEMIDDLLSVSRSVSEQYLAPALEFLLLRVAARTDVEPGLRQLALNPIQWLAKQRPRLLCRGQFVPQLLDLIVSMAAEPDSDESALPAFDSVDEDTEEITPYRIACQALDSISVALPNKYVCLPMLQRLDKYIQNTAPGAPRVYNAITIDPNTDMILKARAALVCIGIMSEGCEAVMRNKLKFIIHFVLENLQSGKNPHISAAAALCFGQFAEYLQPEIMSYARDALPLLQSLMCSNSQIVQHKACYALDVLLENMEGPDIGPIAADIVKGIVNVLKSAESDRVHEMCLSAIRSAASAVAATDDDQEAPAGKVIRPLDALASELFMLLTHILNMPLRQSGDRTKTGCLSTTKARAIGVIGGLVLGLSPECYEAQLPQLMTIVLEQFDLISNSTGESGEHDALTSEAHEVRDEAFSCFRDIASALKHKFEPYLHEIMIRVLASLLSEDGLIQTKGNFSEDYIGDDDDAANNDIHIRDGFLDELDSAALCLRTFWEACGGLCMKYIQKTEEIILHLKNHYHETARQQCCFLIKAVQITTQESLVPNSSKTRVMEMHPTALKLWSTKLYPALFEIIESDTGKEIVGDAFSALGSMIEELGPCVIFSGEQFEQLLQQLLVVLENKHPCQLMQDTDDEDDTRQEEEYLFEGIVVYISALASTASYLAEKSVDSTHICNMNNFTQLYQKIHAPLFKLATHPESGGYASIGLGCFAEVYRHIKFHSIPYVVQPVFLDALIKGIKQADDEDYRRNACFCLSVVYEVAGTEAKVLARTPDFLSALKDIFKTRDELNISEHYTFDNALSAVGSMFTYAPIEALSWDEMVPAFLASLPLRRDHEEAKTILLALISIAQKKPDLVQSHAQQFLTVAMIDASHPTTVKIVDERTLQTMNTILRDLAGSVSGNAEVMNGIKNSIKDNEYAVNYANTQIFA